MKMLSPTSCTVRIQSTVLEIAGCSTKCKVPELASHLKFRVQISALTIAINHES